LLHAAIGNQYYGVGERLNELKKQEQTLTISSSSSITSRSVYISIPTSGLAVGIYDLYVKIGDSYSPILDDVITVQEETTETDSQLGNLTLDSYDTNVTVGGVCRLYFSFDYQGPERELSALGQIGHQYYGVGARFSAKVKLILNIGLGKTDSLYRYSGFYIDIPITSGKIEPDGSPFDIEVVLYEGSGASGNIIERVRSENVIWVT
jgi:hypothetical protein